MTTFSARDVAVRRVTRFVSQLAVMAAILPAASHGGLVDAVGVEDRAAAAHSTTKIFGRSVVDDSSSFVGTSRSSNPSAAIIGSHDSSSGLIAQALHERPASLQAELRAAGYVADPAFHEPVSSVAAGGVVSFAQDGNIASVAGGQGGAGLGSEWAGGIDLRGIPDWLRRVRLGIRTTAFTFYLSPSIPGMDGAEY